MLGVLACVGHVGVPDRRLLWVVAQGAIALSMASSRTLEQAARRAFCGQIATSAIGTFVVLRDELDPIAMADVSTLSFLVLMAALGGGLAGSGLAACQYALFHVMRRASGAPSHDAVARAAVAGCTMLAVGNALSVGLAVGHEPRLAWVAAVGIAVPAAIAAGCVCRRALLRRWLARVEAGTIEGWRIVALRDAWSKLGLLPVLGCAGASQVAEGRVLVRTADAKHPFRDADRFLPVALVTGRSAAGGS